MPDIWEDLLQIREGLLKEISRESYVYLSDIFQTIAEKHKIIISRYNVRNNLTLQVMFEDPQQRSKEALQEIFTHELQLDSYDYFKVKTDGTGEFSYTPCY